MYNDLVVDHFTNPRNAGTMEDADGVGVASDVASGDMIRMSIKVKDSRLDDVRFQAFGCSAAIAASSMATELVKGRPLEYARSLTKNAIAEALGGLPGDKMHCSVHAADALHRALDDYERRIQS